LQNPVARDILSVVREPTVAACSEAVRNCLCFNLRKLTRSVKGVYDQALREADLSSGQFALLLALRIGGPLTKRDLAEMVRAERSALTRNLHPLIRRKLVEEREGSDRRTRFVSLTPAGVEAIQRGIPRWRNAQKRATQLLSQEGMNHLLGAVQRSLEIVSKSEQLSEDLPIAKRRASDQAAATF